MGSDSRQPSLEEEIQKAADVIFARALREGTLRIGVDGSVPSDDDEGIAVNGIPRDVPATPRAKAESLGRLLAIRFGTVPDVILKQLLDCQNGAALDDAFEKALDAETLAQIPWPG